MDNRKTITRLLRVITNAILHKPTAASLDYGRTVEALELLASAVVDDDSDGEELWCLGGDFGYCLSELLPAAYWHLSEWHGGQWSNTYRALCAVGAVFSPGMSDGPEPDSCEEDIKQLLDEMAEKNS